MFPSNYFNLFPPFPRENKVFVAMSFHPMFQERWKNVIDPAIRRVEINNIPLKPHRVDTRKVSDSILTEILTGVSRSLLIFADVSSIGKIDDKPSRNGNVMYEVGLAHATRLPEEVVLFRSDNDELLFDVANVRVNSYDPDNNPEEAIKRMGNAIIESLKEVDLKKNLAIKAAAKSLDYTCWEILLHATTINEVYSPSMKTFGQALGSQHRLSAISRLLEIGALETNYLQITPELVEELKDQPVERLVKYQLTSFGIALIGYIFSKMGAHLSPGMREKIERLIDEGSSTNKANK